MFITLAIVVFAASIIVFFSQEFASVTQWIFDFKGAKELIPLGLGSWLMYQFHDHILSELLNYRDFLKQIIDSLTQNFSLNQYGTGMLTILLLTLISVFPVVILNIYCRHKTYRAYPYPYITSLILWLVSALPLYAN